MAAALLVGACASAPDDQNVPAAGGQNGDAGVGPSAPVTAPPSLRTVDSPASSVPVSGSTEDVSADATPDSPTADELRSVSESIGADDPASATGDDLPDASVAGGASDTAQVAPEPQTASAPTTAFSLAETKFTLVPVAEVPAPIALASRPGTAQRYVASRLGQVWLLDPSDGSGEPQQVADFSAKVSQGCENGLLGIAFSPEGDRLYLSYTDTARNSRIVVVPMEGEVPQADRARVLLALDQPACNHNGGEVQLGPDSNLWIGFGDGGGADDIFGQGQDRDTLLGTLVRVDPDPPSGRGYGIPAGNPFGSGDAPEVWAYGARNPWRFSFDRLTGDLWVADVGQNRIEEIHVLPAADGWSPGANLGWPLFEGNERFSGDETPPDLVFPVYTYTHSDGCSVTGGYVYRGIAIEALNGTYVFGDYCTGDLWGLVRNPDGAAERIGLGVSVPRNSLVSFGQDADGELYVLSAAGTVLRLEPAAP